MCTNAGRISRAASNKNENVALFGECLVIDGMRTGKKKTFLAFFLPSNASSLQSASLSLSMWHNDFSRIS